MPRNPYPPPIAVSSLRRNLEAPSCPRLKGSVRKFGELTPLKLLAVWSAGASFDAVGHKKVPVSGICVA
jgi:hypothetical protein